jgi:hypothetical protein
VPSDEVGRPGWEGHRRLPRVARGADCLDGLTKRGMRPLPLIISDGVAGLIAASDSTFPRSPQEKWLIHRAHLLARRGSG